MKTSLFALGSLVVLIAAPLAAQDYAIRMQQPLKVGQRYILTAAGSESSENTMTSEQRVLKTQKEDLSIEMESEVTVLAVDAKGRATKESHTIVKLVEGAGKEPLLAAGTKVAASRRERNTVFEIAGKPATETVAKALNLAVEITSGSGPTDDEIFGTRERKKIGDRWPLNEALALKDANEKIGASGLKVDSVKGTTTLQRVTKDGSVEVIHLLGDMTATLSPAPKGPFTSGSSTMTATFTGAFPADLTKSARQEGAMLSMALKASIKPPEGPVVEVSGKMKRSITRHFKLLD